MYLVNRWLRKHYGFFNFENDKTLDKFAKGFKTMLAARFVSIRCNFIMTPKWDLHKSKPSHVMSVKIEFNFCIKNCNSSINYYFTSCIPNALSTL